MASNAATLTASGYVRTYLHTLTCVCIYLPTYMCVRPRLRRQLYLATFWPCEQQCSGEASRVDVGRLVHTKERERGKRRGGRRLTTVVECTTTASWAERAKGSLASTKVTRERVLARWEQRRCRADRQLGCVRPCGGRDGPSQQSSGGVFGSSRVAACGDLRGCMGVGVHMCVLYIHYLQGRQVACWYMCT